MILGLWGPKKVLVLRTRLAQMPDLGQTPVGPYRQLEAAASPRSPLGPMSRVTGLLWAC